MELIRRSVTGGQRVEAGKFTNEMFDELYHYVGGTLTALKLKQEYLCDPNLLTYRIGVMLSNASKVTGSISIIRDFNRENRDPKAYFQAIRQLLQVKSNIGINPTGDDFNLFFGQPILFMYGTGDLAAWNGRATVEQQDDMVRGLTRDRRNLMVVEVARLWERNNIREPNADITVKSIPVQAVGEDGLILEPNPFLKQTLAHKLRIIQPRFVTVSHLRAT